MKAESMYKASREILRNFTREENDELTRVGPGTLMGICSASIGFPLYRSSISLSPEENRCD